MALASFALVSRRWKSSTVSAAEYSAYLRLIDYLPKENSYMFVLALAFVVAAAAFSIIARSQDVPIWYPLLILIAPAVIAYWTTRRRGMHTLRLSSFQDALQTTLKEMTLQDAGRQVKWGYRRQRLDDTAEDLHLPPPLDDWSIILVIQVVQIDPEVGLLDDTGDALPTYLSVQDDLVLDVGPPMQQVSATGFDAPTGAQTANFAPMAYPPPAYTSNTASTVDLSVHQPPAYDASHTR